MTPEHRQILLEEGVEASWRALAVPFRFILIYIDII